MEYDLFVFKFDQICCLKEKSIYRRLCGLWLWLTVMGYGYV